MRLPTPPNWLLAVMVLVATVLAMLAYSLATGLIYQP